MYVILERGDEMDILDEIEKGGIYIRHAVDEAPDDRHFAFHVHDRCEIYYFLSGNAAYLVEGSSYPLEKGSLLIMRPGEAHCARILSRERYERYAVNFPLSLFDSIDPERRLMLPFTDRKLGRGNMLIHIGLEDTFSEMLEKKADDYERILVFRTKILYLLDLINAGSKDGICPEKEFTSSERILRYVNEHLFDDISLTGLSDHFFISTSQFVRIFKKATGAPPWEYITAKRLIAAREM